MKTILRLETSLLERACKTMMENILGIFYVIWYRVFLNEKLGYIVSADLVN